VNSLTKVIGFLYRKLSPVTAVSNAIGMVALAAMMFLTTIDVIGRKTLNAPVMGSYEVIQFLMAVTVGLGIAHCGIKKGHINIDFITMHLSKRVNGILGIVTGFIALVIIGLATWQTSIYITMQAKTNVQSSVLLIPIYPFVGIAAFGLALFWFVLLIHWLEFMQQGLSKDKANGGTKK
jgi:TRAP-type C4-dicarboxylate transport system permease small subunit